MLLLQYDICWSPSCEAHPATYPCHLESCLQTATAAAGIRNLRPNMDKEVFSKLPKDLLQSVYPDLADQRLKSKYIQTLLEAANALFQQPTPYNSLRDKNLRGYFERPQVKEFLKRSGFVADGCYVVTKEEEKLADKARRLLAEREAILSKLQQKEQDRLERLCRLTTPLKNVTGTDSFMDRQLQSIQETKRKLFNLRAQGQPVQPATKHSDVDHRVGVQTRSKVCSEVECSS